MVGGVAFTAAMEGGGMSRRIFGILRASSNDRFDTRCLRLIGDRHRLRHGPTTRAVSVMDTMTMRFLS